MGKRANERKNEKRHENNISLSCFSLRVFRSSVRLKNAKNGSGSSAGY